MTLLEEEHHSLIFVEHGPFLYEDAAKMTKYVSLIRREASKEAAVLLYCHIREKSVYIFSAVCLRLNVQ
jgi:hypothetical protein